MSSDASIVLYGCIVERYDPLPPAPFMSAGVRHVLFTDDVDLAEAAPPGWEARYIQHQLADPVRTARWHKHHPLQLFPEAEYSIWLDGTHAPKTDISDFPARFLQAADIAAYPHFAHHNTYDELSTILLYGLDDVAVCRAQYDRQLRAGFPDDGPGFDTTVLVRRHCGQIAWLQQVWWELIEQGSRRDQLSFPFALWQTGTPCATITPGYSRAGENPYFTYQLHDGCWK